MKFPKQIIVHYYGESFLLEFKNPENNEMDIGHVMLSKAGQELASLCGSKARGDFKDYVVDKWASIGMTVIAANKK